MPPPGNKALALPFVDNPQRFAGILHSEERMRVNAGRLRTYSRERGSAAAIVRFDDGI